MSLQLRDTLSGQKRPFVPIDPKRIGVYSCGPTIYGPAHIGNFRSFLFADVLVRWLRASGYPTTWVVNLTDIDDKIIRASKAEGIEMRPLTDRWEAVFRSDAMALRMTTPDHLPRATEHVDEQVDLVSRLLERDIAYRAADGSIFFRIGAWPTYGQLARLDPDSMRVGERIESDEYTKDDVRDFVLWKAAKEGEPAWDTSIGRGRPGWHLECSAMSMRYLGESFDLHTGGIDLIFPHHEDEIAQSEAATGKPFVGTWLHCAHLHVSGDKMSKSIGNISRVSELLSSGVDPRALRLALISAPSNDVPASKRYTKPLVEPKNDVSAPSGVSPSKMQVTGLGNCMGIAPSGLPRTSIAQSWSLRLVLRTWSARTHHGARFGSVKSSTR